MDIITSTLYFLGFCSVIAFSLAALILIPMGIVFVYSIPYHIYCSGRIPDENYDKLPIANFPRLFFLATKCYICLILRKQNNHLDRVFPPQ